MVAQAEVTIHLNNPLQAFTPLRLAIRDLPYSEGIKTLDLLAQVLKELFGEFWKLNAKISCMYDDDQEVSHLNTAAVCSLINNM